MTESVLINYIYILLFLFAGFVAALAPFVISHLVRPRGIDYRKTMQAYECGIDPFCSTREYRYGISFYVYAVIFLAFDVDVLYLFPVSAAFNTVSAMRGIVEIFIFIGVLSLAIVYAWAKGVFTWQKKRTVC
jgi:NADH-quinone oxidoreductase subunit A